MKYLLITAIALMTIGATAQEQKRDTRSGDEKERMETRQELAPEEMAQLQTKKMTLHLDLTAAQQVEVQKLLLEEAKERKTKMEAYKAKQETGMEKPSKDDRLKIQNARLDHQIEMKKKMKAILNADQYEKYEDMRSKRDGYKRGMHDKGKSKQ